MTGVFIFWFFLSHLIGDYLLQTHEQATRKTSSWRFAIEHGFAYSIPYAVLLSVYFYGQPVMWVSWAIIFVTHVIIDRFRLAKPLMWFKNQITAYSSARFPWAEGKENNGYPKGTPVWLSTWLMIVADNTVHLIINFLAVFWLFSL